MRVRSGRAARGKAPVAGTRALSGAGRSGAEAPVGGQWLINGRDGRLSAYARHASGLLRWTESRPGGSRWTGPDLIEAPGMTHVHVAQGPDGYVHLVARRSVSDDSASPTTDIVHAIQYQSGRPQSAWHSLGSPHKEKEKAAQTGPPVVAVGSDGAVNVFARNAGGGISMRREDKSGKWGGWKDLKGSLTEDGMVASPGAGGGMELFVPGSGQALRWVQTTNDGPFEQAQSIPVKMAPGGVAGLETAPGRHTYYWTDAAGNGIVAYRPGSWAIPLGGNPAEGPVTTLRATLDGHDCTVLAHRDPDGQVMLAACGTENEGAGLWWSPTGERTAAGPALTLDAFGRVVLGMIGADGALYIARQNPEPGLAMAPAVRIG